MPFRIHGEVGRVTIGSVEYVELQTGDENDSLYDAAGYLAGLLNKVHYDDAAAVRKDAAWWLGKMGSNTFGRGKVIRPYVLTQLGRLKSKTDPMSTDYDVDFDKYVTAVAKEAQTGDFATLQGIEAMIAHCIDVYGPDGARMQGLGGGHGCALPCSDPYKLVARPIRRKLAESYTFNPLVPAEQLAKATKIEAPGGRRSRYWISKKETRPYVPPVCFCQYPTSFTKPKASILVAFSNLIKKDSVAAPAVTAAVLTNTDAKTQETLASVSYTWASAQPDTAVRPELSLPLTLSTETLEVLPPRYDSQPELRFTTADVTVTGAVPQGGLRFDVLRYAAPDAEEAVLLSRTLDRTALEKLGKLDQDGAVLSVPLRELWTARQVRVLNWTLGPFLLRVAPAGDSELPHCAWTYFSVPSPWEVSTLEDVGPEAVIVLRDDMQPLGKSVTPRTHKSMAVFSPTASALDVQLKLDDQDSREKFGSGAAVQEFGALLRAHGKAYDYNTVNVLYQRENGTWFAATSWASVIVCRKEKDAWSAHSLFTVGNNRWLGTLRKKGDGKADPLSRDFAIIEPDDEWVVTTDVGQDHDLETAWKCYYLHLRKERYPLAVAHTAGISSCAGGVTFDAGGKEPEWLIVWHVDAMPACPVRRIVEMIWPRPKDRPPLRSIGLIYPDPAELNKYRKVNLYPKESLENSETVFLVRGAHLYHGRVASNCGADVFGVDFSAGLSLVGSYDLSQSALRLREHQRDACALSATRLDHDADIFGTYRFEKKMYETNEKMALYLEALSGRAMDVRVDKARSSYVYSLAGLGKGLYDELAKLSRPLLDAGCTFVGEKGELELSSDLSAHWQPRAHEEGSSRTGTWYDPELAELLLAIQAMDEGEQTLQKLQQTYNVVPVSGDGNCLFRAFAVVYRKDANAENNHADYRTAAVTHMRNAPLVFSYDRLGIDGSGVATRTAYLDVMAQPATQEMQQAERRSRWGGGPELAALSRRYRVRIHVHTPDDHTVVFEELEDNTLSATSDAHLYFQGGNHYTALLPKN